jgi:predicted Zn-dependent protease
MTLYPLFQKLKICVCLLGLSIFLVHPQTSGPLRKDTRLPSLGDGSEMALGEERHIGESVMREIFKDPDYIEDPILLDYLLSIWQPLIEASKLRGDLSDEMEQRFAWQGFLVKDPSINAFALPGGYMGVHLGLISAVSNRDELASVLAHELSHITQRHISRLFAQQAQQTPLMLGAMILGIIAAGKNPNAASALMVGGQAAATQSQLNFSRDMEREADRVGYGVMLQAGYDGSGFVSMFQKLQQASRLNDNGSYPYLRSHPLTTERIADMASRQIGSFEGTQAQNSLPSNWVHLMMSSRAKVLTKTNSDSYQLNIDLAQKALTNPKEPVSNQIALLYAGGLSSLKIANFTQARRFLSSLDALSTQGKTPELSLQISLLKAQFFFLDNQPMIALEILDALPKSRAVTFMLCENQLKLSTKEAQQTCTMSLRDWLNKHPRDIHAWELLSDAQYQSQDLLSSIRSMAEAYALKLDYAPAIDRLYAAQTLSKEIAKKTGLSKSQEMESSIIDSRLRTLLALRREQSLQR